MRALFVSSSQPRTSHSNQRRSIRSSIVANQCICPLDLVVDGRLVVELKCVDCLHPVHLAQLRSCLKVSGLRLGLLVNFNVALLQQGIRRVVL